MSQPLNNPNIPNNVLDEALAKNLDQEGLLRLKAVEETVKFSMGKNPTISDVDNLINKFYNFLKDGISEQSNSDRKIR